MTAGRSLTLKSCIAPLEAMLPARRESRPPLNSSAFDQPHIVERIEMDAIAISSLKKRTGSVDATAPAAYKSGR